MLEIKITVPEDGLFRAMQLIGSDTSKIAELTTTPGVKVQLKAEKLDVEWSAEGFAEIPSLGSDQTEKQ